MVGDVLPELFLLLLLAHFRLFVIPLHDGNVSQAGSPTQS